MIPLSVPTLKGNEWKYVKECLDAGWLSSGGPYVERFERDFAACTGARHSVACVNGTAALQVALRVVGVGAGDEVIVPTLTFIATVNAVHYLGAAPVFMDCDEFYNIDVQKMRDFLDEETVFREGKSYSRESGRRIAAVVPVHVFGNAARLQELVPLCRERNIRIVEDAAESLGTRYLCPELQGRHTGTVGDIGCFSFNGNKIITTGGGGMIVTEVAAYADKARYLTTQAKDDEVRYIHHEVGYNFRLTAVQAAVGVAQLELLPEFLRVKHRIYEGYREAVEGIEGLTLGESPPYAQNNHWMCPLQIDREAYGMDRDELMAHLAAQGIQTRPTWHLNHLQGPYRRCRSYAMERAPRLLEVTLSLPCSTGLTEEEVAEVIRRLRHG